MFQEDDAYDHAAREAVELGNQLLERDKEALWDVADGLLAGAIHFWLYARQPCGDPRCEDCAPISTAEQRLAELLQLTRELAEDSDYYHSPNDTNVGRA
ncbi:MAG: hypothetical protein WDA11_00130 [Thiohalomonadaceae bacterium]